MRAAPVESKTVLITGCSSGIGWSAAQYLRQRGWAVWPTARQPKDLDRLRAEGFEPLELDLLDSGSVRRTAEEALRRGRGRVGALVNNAGYGQPGAVEDLSREALRRQFEVNLFGLQELTNRLILVFRQQGYGRIVNISSVLGRITIPLMGAYAASKHALEAMSDAWRMELRGSGVAVSVVEPGPIETNFRKNAFEQAQQHVEVEKSPFRAVYERQARRKMAAGFRSTDPFTTCPEAVVRRIQHALESRRPRTRYRITLPAHLGEMLRRFAPDAFMDWALTRRMG